MLIRFHGSSTARIMEWAKVLPVLDRLHQIVLITDDAMLMKVAGKLPMK